MQISILGAGWLGKALITALKEKNYTLNASTRKSSKLVELDALGAKSFLIDYLKENGVYGDTSFLKCDCLVICMAPGRKNSGESLYLEALKSYLDIALELGTKKLIFTSSTGIYGDMTGIVKEEDMNFDNKVKETQVEVYLQRVLLQAENLVLENKNINVYVLRLAGLIGPGRQAGRFLAGKKNVASPNAPVNLAEQSDVVAIIASFIEHEYPIGIYNICADEHPTRKEFFTQQAHMLGLEAPEFDEKDNAIGKTVSNEKVKKVLNFKFKNLLLT